ncbi:DUF58 domain-containing protein [Candidatus Woesearchaeota archaeon]|nr:DUF58 domain-containing protein [Candidatus Woesearchaeota archaeon]
MIDLSFLQKLDKLTLIIRKNLTSNYSGERRSKEIGQGLLFADHTIYTEGDDIRHVDWKVFGRTDKLFIKRFEEERNLTVHVLVDFSGSMGFGSHKMLKSTYAAMMAIGFAYIALRNNERFVLSTFDERLLTYRPKRGRRQLAQMFDVLNNRKPKGKTSFESSISSYKRLIDSKSLVIVISDFLYDLDEIKNVLLKLRKNQVKFVQVLDPVELKLMLEGSYKLKDLETSDVLRTYISPALRKKYLRLLSKHNAAIKQLCEETNSSFYTVSTETPIYDAFYEVLSAK